MKEFAPLAPDLLDHLTRKCLAKDPEERWQSARDLASELQWIGLGTAAESAPAAVARKRERWYWAAAVIVLCVTSVLAFWRGRAAPPTRRAMQVPLTVHQELWDFGLSPDGEKLLLQVGDPATFCTSLLHS
jgi:hypothetical protein